MATDLSLPQSASRIRSIEINTREYLSSIVPPLLQSCKALEKVRLVVTGCSESTDLKAQSFFNALRFHQNSLQEVYYYSLHEPFELFEQGKVFESLSECNNLTRLSTSILPFADATGNDLWTRVPKSLQHLTIFDSKGYFPVLITPQGPLQILATDHSLFPGLKSIEVTTFFYGWEQEPWKYDHWDKNTIVGMFRSRGVEFSQKDWLD